MLSVGYSYTLDGDRTFGEGVTAESLLEVTPPPTDILFGNSAITNTDGTRSVVSEGTDTTAKLDLYSGQGLRFDGTQFIDTDFSPDLTKDFTLLWEQERVGFYDTQNGSFASSDGRFHFGFNATGVRCGIGDGSGTVSLSDLGTYNLFAKYSVATGSVTFGVNGGDTLTFTTTQVVGILPLYIGVINGLGIVVTGVQKDLYYIPHELTDLELSSHLQNPEQTLYYDKGELKSDLLTQPVVDDIIAGNGFWYPMCDKADLVTTTKTFGSTPDMTLGVSQDIVNLVTTDDEFISLGDNTYSIEDDGAFSLQFNMDVGYGYIFDLEVITTNNKAFVFYGGVDTYQNPIFPIGKHKVIMFTTQNDKRLIANSTGFRGTFRLSNLRKLQQITNYVNSPMRDNATKLPYGLQTALIEQDSFGLPIGVADDSELVWVDESYAAPDMPLALTGNFCVDAYVKEIGTTDSTFLNFTTDTIDPILIGVAGATGNVDIALLTEYTSTAINANGAVVSLERDGGTLKAFVNNVEVSRISYSGTVTLDIIGASTTTSNFATGESGSLGFTKTTRTYGQRLSTYNALRAKHGV